MTKESLEVLKGTLDMLVLQILAAEPAHGYAVTRRLEELTGGSLSIDEGSMYPALYRMQKRGWITSEWCRSERGRRAKVYELTGEGRRCRSRSRRFTGCMIASCKRTGDRPGPYPIPGRSCTPQHA